MGFYEDIDSRDLYKTRVTGIPTHKLDNVPPNYGTIDGVPAINQGTPQVRCFIHPYCPFMKVPREEIHLTFNDLTLPVIIDSLPERYKQSLTTSFGTEGIHFTERYVYRHNYLVEEATGTLLVTPYHDILGANLPGLYETTYREEQTWIVRKSVYDDVLTACSQDNRWIYNYPNVSSAYSQMDELLDYNKIYYDENSKFATNGDSNPGINKNDIQMPSQVSGTYCEGAGVHWRVEKKTPLFRGEDFFVEFHRLSKTSSVNEFISGEVSFSPTMPEYAPIDALNETKIDVPMPDGSTFILQQSGAVIEGDTVSITTGRGDNSRDSIQWRLFDQAYYIIELGDETGNDEGDENKSEHYFIILCERAFPIFVAIGNYTKNGQSFKYSKKLGIFDGQVGGVHCSSLINAESFRVTVRNHLGKLVIFFDVDGQRSNNWIVERLTAEKVEIESNKARDAENGSLSSEYVKKNEILSVPNKRVHIWGGNMQSGFIFGPLQYSRPQLRFKWGQPIIMPKNDDGNSGRLTVTDNQVQDMDSNVTRAGRPRNSDSLFAQGTHFFKQWGKSHDAYIQNTFIGPQEGFFLDKPRPLVELSEYRTGGDSIPGVRDSVILLEDPTIATQVVPVGSGTITQEVDLVTYDPRLEKISFPQYIQLQTGSHVFDGESHPNVWKEPATWEAPTEAPKNYWVLDSCKTPILTNIRYVSEADEIGRWKDGTGASGYRGKPNANAPFFRDVSHHVLTYSENWSASDFYEMEHTGSVELLLKPVTVGFATGGSVIWDDTDYLKELQDKAFYIEIWAGYEPLRDGLEYTQLGGFHKMFTGICYGGNINRKADREIMTCQILDYKRILQDQKFFNSPFYDGVRDVDAVKEILDMAGFRSAGVFSPGSILRGLTHDISRTPRNLRSNDGREYRVYNYALPSSYRRIEQPYFKFSAGTSLYDGIMKIAHSASKLFYFDQFGVAHFENYLDIVQEQLLNNGELNSLFDFTTNHFEDPGQLVWNAVEKKYRMEDVHNHIKVTTGTPDLDLISRNDIHEGSLDDPESPGFLGYKKLFYQREGMLGSLGAVENLMEFYKVMFLPELYMKFETQGVPLRATDFIKLDGELLRVTKVSHVIDAEKNKWWMNVEGEKMQPVQ